MQPEAHKMQYYDGHDIQCMSARARTSCFRRMNQNKREIKIKLIRYSLIHLQIFITENKAKMSLCLTN
jgi:tmRNA-binding protein